MTWVGRDPFHLGWISRGLEGVDHFGDWLQRAWLKVRTRTDFFDGRVRRASDAGPRQRSMKFVVEVLRQTPFGHARRRSPFEFEPSVTPFEVSRRSGQLLRVLVKSSQGEMRAGPRASPEGGSKGISWGRVHGASSAAAWFFEDEFDTDDFIQATHYLTTHHVPRGHWGLGAVPVWGHRDHIYSSYDYSIWYSKYVFHK